MESPAAHVRQSALMKRASSYSPPDKSVSKIYYFISDGVKQEPLKLWRLLLLVLLLVLCMAFTSSLWVTNVFWLTVREFTTLQNNSVGFNFFENLPVVDMQFCIHIFNYTNVDRFYSRRPEEAEDQLEVQFLGPYCFRETPQKINLKFHDDLHRLSYKENSKFTFDPAKSNGSLSEMVVVPNFPYLVTTSLAVDCDFVTRAALSFFIRSYNYEPFVRLNVSDFLFGYDDELMDRIVAMASIKGIKVPFTRFGLIDAISSFLNVEMEVDTGVDDLTRVGKVTGFKGKSNMTFWKTPACNQYQGGEGTFWDVERVQEGKNVEFFALLLCQNIEFRKIGEVEFIKGATVPRYEIIPDMFDSRRPGFDCYCRNCTSNIGDITQCLDGFPFMASLPKFYGVDPVHLSHLKGLPEPDPNAWSTMFDIHPYLGITLRFTQRMQLNLNIRKSSSSSLPPKIQNGQLLPTVSLERYTQNLRPDAASLLYHALTTLPIMEVCLRYGGLLVATYLSYVMIRDFNRMCNYESSISRSHHSL